MQFPDASLVAPAIHAPGISLSTSAVTAIARADLRLDVVDALDDAREPWQALQDDAGRPFSTWEWASAWWRVYGGGRRLVLGVLRREDGTPAAVLPLYRAKRLPLTVMRLIGHGAADELGPVCRPDDTALAVAAMRRVASEELPGMGVLLMDRLRNDEPILETIPGTVLRREATPVLDRAGRSWEEWLAESSRNLREQLRSRERRLLRAHGLRYRLTTTLEELDADFPRLLALHRARWGAASSAFDPQRAALHRDFARRALERGWLRLWTAEVDGEAIAAWYGFRFGDSEWYYQSGRDPGWDRTSVGLVLLAHTIRAAFEDGVRTYRFGLGDEPYKARFASSDPGLSSIALGAPGLERALGAVMEERHRLPGIVRRAIARRLA